MKLPIRNNLDEPMTLFIEPWCDEYEIPPHGEAQITLNTEASYSMDMHPGNWLSFWNDLGSERPIVQVFSKHQLNITG